MSLLTDLFSQLGQNYTVNSQGDEQQRQEQIAREREAYLARLKQQAQLGQDPYWGQTQVGQAEAQKAQQELDRVLAFRDQNYPTTTGQQIAETVGMVGSEVQQGAPIRRALTPPDATSGQKKAIAGGSQLVSMLGQALVGGRLPLPEGAPKSLPKPMSIVPEEAGLIAKASGAKPIYGAAQKGAVAKGMTASPAQLKSMTDLQASVGGDVGSALRTERAVPMRGHTLNQAPKIAQKAPGNFNVTGSDGTVIGTDGKVIKELGEQGGVKYKQVEYTDPTTGKRITSSVPEPNLRSAQTEAKGTPANTPTPAQGSVPVAQASTQTEVPKTKWQRVKKGVGSAAKVAGIAGPAFMLGRNWDENAGLPARPAFDPTFSALNSDIGPSAADQFTQQGTQQGTQAPAQKEPSFIEKLLQQVLTQGQQSQREGSLTEEQLLQRMESMMNQPQPPPPQVPDGKPTSTLGIIMDALGRGLIAGGTGQADPDAAQKLEMERMTTNQNLAQNARKLTPQQEMTMQMLQSLLVNKMQQGNIVQQGAQSQQNALIQAIVASQLGSQQTGINQQFTAGQNELDRASAEKIANMRAEAETRQMLETLRYYDERQRAKSGQAPSDPKVNF